MKIYELYQSLLADHGHPREIWPQWCGLKKDERQRELVAIGAVLTQRTSWRNAEMALRNLKQADLLSLKRIAEVNLERLTELVRVAGFYTTKPRRLQELAGFVVERYGSLTELSSGLIELSSMQKMSQLRKELLGLYGIGPETADTLLLYALDLPSFVIDEYTRRFVEKYGLCSERNPDDKQGEVEDGSPGKPGLRVRGSHLISPSIRQLADSGQKDYEDLKNLFESSLPRDLEIYQNYHVLIIVDQKGREKSVMEVI